MHNGDSHVTIVWLHQHCWDAFLVQLSVDWKILVPRKGCMLAEAVHALTSHGLEGEV